MTLAHFLRIVRQRVRSLTHPGDMDAELERELAFHLEALAAEKIAGGLSPDEARLAARRELGNVGVIEAECRDTRRVGWIDDLRQDLVHGFRLLRKDPGLTIAASFSLALGIGVHAAVLRAVDAAMIEGLRLPDADRRVAMRAVPPSGTGQLENVSTIDFAAWRDRSRSFQAIGISRTAALIFGPESNGAPAERIRGLAVTPGYFDALAMRPAMGRVFSPEESRLVDPRPAIIISERLWRERFDADPAILSRQARTDDTWRPIIGVMPDDARYRDIPIDCWIALRVLPTLEFGSGRSLRAFGLLRPGVTIGQAETELNGIAAQLGREWGSKYAGWGVRLRPVDELMLDWSRKPIAILVTIATLVLLIACANVAGLLLARSSARRAEIGMRLALGAHRGRLIRQFLTEGVLLASLGGVLAIAVAWAGAQAIASLAPPPGSPAIAPIGLDWRTVAITSIVTLAAGLTFSLVPAISASSRRPLGPAWPWTHRVLTTAQVAVTLALLVGSGLLLNSLIRVAGRDLHFVPDHLLGLEVGLPVERKTLLQGRGQYFDVADTAAGEFTRIADRLRGVPHVDAVSGSSFRAIDSFVIPRFAVTAGTGQPVTMPYALVMPGYFETMHTAIVRGREIRADDTPTNPWVAVVNEAAAERLWPGHDPIGRRVTLDTVSGDQPRVVVGIVRNIPTRHGDVPEPVIYASYLQQPGQGRGPRPSMSGQMVFAIRYTGETATVIADIRRALGDSHPDLPLNSLAPVTANLYNGRGALRTLTMRACVLALTGVALAMIGIYGVMAYGVSRETREIAVRRALGAGTVEILTLLARRGGAILGVGLVLGLAGAWPLGRFLAPQLWGIAPTDPMTYAAACLLLAAVAILGSLAPARRAVAVDATIALRVE